MPQSRTTLLVYVVFGPIMLFLYPLLLAVTRRRPKHPKLLLLSVCLYIGLITGIVSGWSYYAQARQLDRRGAVATVVFESIRLEKPKRPTKEQLINEIRIQARVHNVPTGLALAIANWETGIEHWTKDGIVKGANANSPQVGIGVFQLLPGTAREMLVDPQDPYQNVEGGVKYIAHLMTKFKTRDTSDFKVPKALEARFKKDPIRFLTIAAYRAGYDRIVKSKGIPDAPTGNWSRSLWESVMQYVPGVFDSSYRMD